MYFDITAYGAVGDAATLNTAAIQRAVDEAGQCGGTVVVPPGTFLTGTIFLRSGITLDIHPAGCILGSPNLEDYKAKSWGQHIDRTPWHLLAAVNLHDLRITGGGTIDGNGPAFWEPCVAGPDAAAPRAGAFGGLDPLTCLPARQPDPAKAPISWIRANKEKRPSPMIEITGCRDVRIENIQITNSAGWLLHLHNSRFAWIRGVKLTANLMGPNNDGFDITGCHDVMVSDCALSCCDDAICLKTTPDSNTIERVTVTNCVIRTRCVALKLGCNESFHDFRGVVFSNCVVYESSRAFAMYTKQGGNMEDIAVTNIVCDTRNPFVMNRPLQIQVNPPPDGTASGRIRNVLIAGVIARTDGRMLFTAPDDAPIENLVLRDVQVIYPAIDDPRPLGPRIPCGQFPGRLYPEAAAARAVVVAENVRNLAVENLMVAWPRTDADGRVVCPADWHFPVKAVNGAFDVYYERREFNTDRVPDFHLVWGRRIRGGVLRAPLAQPPRAGIARYDLRECDSVAD